MLGITARLTDCYHETWKLLDEAWTS